MIWIWIWFWENENGNDGFEIWENENDFDFKEIEMNDGLKTNENDKLIMLNDFKIDCLSFGSTWTIDLWIADLLFQKIQIITNWKSDWLICLIMMIDDK